MLVELSLLLSGIFNIALVIHILGLKDENFELQEELNIYQDVAEARDEV